MARDHYETLQQVFDDAYLGLAGQGFERSMEEHDVPDAGCAYRGIDNRRCAIGHCIPDDLYNPAIEGSVPNGEFDRYPEARALFGSLFGSIDQMALNELQSAHDESFFPLSMRAALHRFAQRRNLNIPSIAA